MPFITMSTSFKIIHLWAFSNKLSNKVIHCWLLRYDKSPVLYTRKNGQDLIGKHKDRSLWEETEILGKGAKTSWEESIETWEKATETLREEATETLREEEAAETLQGDEAADILLDADSQDEGRGWKIAGKYLNIGLCIAAASIAVVWSSDVPILCGNWTDDLQYILNGSCLKLRLHR